MEISARNEQGVAEMLHDLSRAELDLDPETNGFPIGNVDLHLEVPIVASDTETNAADAPAPTA